MLAYLKNDGKRTLTLNAFKGLDRRENAPPGSFARMLNGTLQSSPSVSSRPPRGGRTDRPEENETAFAAFEYSGRCLVTKRPYGAEFEYLLRKNGKVYSICVTNEYLRDGMPDREQKALLVGKYLLLLPLGSYLDLDALPEQPDPSDSYGGSVKIDSQWATYPRFCLSNADGEPVPGILFSPEEPSDTDRIWVDTSGSIPVMKKYSAKSGEWEQVKKTYVRIEGIWEKNGEIPAAGEKMRFVNTGCGLDGVKRLVKCDTGEEDPTGKVNGYFVVEGIIPRNYTDERPFPVSMYRAIPEMDHVIECGNRLWGCRYGENDEGEFVNEIYASSPGTFDRFCLFEGLSTDSFISSRGSPGPFTGAVNYFGVPVFFKEDLMVKVHGTVPQTYQVSDLPSRGVKPGCARSLCTVGQKLYYMSSSGVTVYDGGLPVGIGEELGDLSKVSYAAAARSGDLYCLSVRENSGRALLYVYDTKKGLWSMEDDANALFFTGGRELCFFDGEGLRAACGKNGEKEVSWSFETGKLDCGIEESKYVSSLSARVSMPSGSVAEFFVRFDGEGEWRKVRTAYGRGVQTLFAFVRPKKCACFEIRISGRGPFRLDSLKVRFGSGGERGSGIGE